MSFWTQYKAMTFKNVKMFWRDWKGTLLEFAIPIFFMLIILDMSREFNKNESGPFHLLSSNQVWYDDTNGPATGQNFLGYTAFENADELRNFKYCTDREYGPDRSIIALAPEGNSMINEIKAAIEADILNQSFSLSVKVYQSRDEIMELISSKNYEKDGSDGICFGAALTKTESNEYQVNMIFDDISKNEGEDSNMPNQEYEPADKIQREPMYDSYDQYRYGGYMYLQNLFANALLRDKTGSSTAYVSMIYAQSKSSVYNQDRFSEKASQAWPFFVPFLFMVSLYRLIKFVVADKETKIRETMKCLGMSDLCYWLSWLSYYAVMNTLLCTVMILILIPAFEFTHLFLVFLHLWIYGMTIFSLGVFVSAFFINSGKAAKSGTLIFYASSFLFLWVAKDNASEGVKIASSFIPVLGVQIASYNLFDYENSQIGLKFDNASDLYNNYRFST